MEVKSQFLYCPNYSATSIDNWRLSNYFYAITGFIGLTVALLLLSLLILYKAFKTVLQRLLLYYTLALIATDVVQFLNVELQFDVNREFCSWLGFLGQWQTISSSLLAIGLVVYISIITIQKARSQPLCKCLKKVSPKILALFEVVYLSVTVLLPGAALIIFLKEEKYGVSESICWLRKLDDNCIALNSTSGSQYLNLSVPILRAVLTLGFLVLMIVFHMTVLKYQQSHKTKCSSLCRSLFLFSIVVISLIAKLCEAFVNFGLDRIINVQVNYFYYDLFDELVQTILNHLLLCGFAAYIYSPKKLRCASMKTALQDWSNSCLLSSCCCHGNRTCSLVRHKRSRQSADDVVEEESNTFESSVNCSTPSHTTYSTPYTNEFTDITEVLSFAQEDNKLSKYGSMDGVV